MKPHGFIYITTNTINGKKYTVGIHEFSLKDGTRCVTVYSNGINCNWRP